MADGGAGFQHTAQRAWAEMAPVSPLGPQVHLPPPHEHLATCVHTRLTASADLLLAMLERPHVQAAVAASPALGARLDTVPHLPHPPQPCLTRRCCSGCRHATHPRPSACWRCLPAWPRCRARPRRPWPRQVCSLVVSVLLCVSYLPVVSLFTQPSSLAAARRACAVGRDQCPGGALGLSSGGPAQPGVRGPGCRYPGHCLFHAAQPGGAWPGGMSGWLAAVLRLVCTY